MASLPKKKILLVEDSDTDIEMIQLVFRKFDRESEFDVVHDGARAMAVLERLAEQGAQKPLNQEGAHYLFILLDLRLPQIDGLDILEYVKAQPVLARIPVVVLTSSALSADIARAYELGANAYVVKPINFSEFEQTLRSLGEFWAQHNQPASSSAEFQWLIQS